MIAKSTIVAMFTGVLLLVAAISGDLATPQAARAEASDAETTTPEYVGRKVCVACHKDQETAWRGSHHDLAMQLAGDDTVLGDFNDVAVTHFGVTTRFFRRDGGFFVSTEGADGRIAEFKISYTFGAIPLQQYLIAFADGRLQALGVAWDSREKAAGGQKWFHLYPDRRIEPSDPLHWTGIDQTWNHMCAECHSTGLRKNYDPATDRYRTSWSEINVSCEACHGPGSAHAAWGEALAKSDGQAVGDNGLAVKFDADINDWSFGAETKIAQRGAPLSSRAELQVCAKCHSRRAPLKNWDADGKDLLQSHNLQLLARGYYFPDGQIEDEVFVYGSFLQSKMYRAGVTCGNCHDPHSLKLRADGNALCGQCHQPEAYDIAAHHFHEAGTKGAKCVSCHMPERTYMVVDPRRDHGFHSPRPDLSDKLGVPNACNACHQDKPASWAAAELAKRFGAAKKEERHFAEALSDGRKGLPGAGDALAKIVGDAGQAAIVRATAVSELVAHLAASKAAIQAFAEAAGSDDALIRLGVVQALSELPPRGRLRLGLSFLDDPVLAVRVAAAGALITLPRNQMPEQVRPKLDEAARIYEEAQSTVSDRPEGRVNLANIHVSRRDFVKAEKELRAAIRLDPAFAAAAVNLADLYRLQNREGDGEAVLKKMLKTSPDAVEAHYSLALLLVRQKRMPEALEHFERAAVLRPEQAQFGYTYGLALQSVGRKDAARAMLKTMLQRHPHNSDLLNAMVSYSLEAGSLDEARIYVKRLAAVRPNDRKVQQLLQRLEAARPEKQ